MEHVFDVYKFCHCISYLYHFDTLNHPAVISHQHTILDPHGSCIPSDCASTWWLQCAVVMERVFSSDNTKAGKPLIIWTNRLEPLGVLGAVKKGRLEYLDTIWIWYNWTIYPILGYNWFLWQQLLIDCATKKQQHLFQFRMPTTIFPPKMTSCWCTAAPLTTSQWWKTKRFHVSLDILSLRMSSISQLQLLLQGTSKDCSSTSDSICNIST